MPKTSEDRRLCSDLALTEKSNGRIHTMLDASCGLLVSLMHYHLIASCTCWYLSELLHLLMLGSLEISEHQIGSYIEIERLFNAP